MPVLPGTRISRVSILIVTAGVGWTQEWGGPVVELRAGDVVWCPPGIKHWEVCRR